MSLNTPIRDWHGQRVWLVGASMDKSFDTQTWETVHGSTNLIFNDECLVTLHRDYWDAAEELYEKLPVFGGLMRWLKRRANS